MKRPLDARTLRWVIRRLRATNRALETQANARRKGGLSRDWYHGAMFAQECFAQGLEMSLKGQPATKRKVGK